MTLTFEQIQHAPADRVATATLNVVFPGAGTTLMAVAIMISTFGCNNGLILAGARAYFAMARDGLFFDIVARVSPRSHVPVAAIATQGVLAALFTLTNAYASLVEYAVFADWVFFALSGVALMVFRKKLPDAPRPVPVPGYPWVPVLFSLAGAGIVFNTFFTDTWNALMGTAIMALGVPVYLLWRIFGRRDAG